MNADDMERLADSLGDRFQDQIRAVRVSRLEAAQVVIRQAASDRAALERVRELHHAETRWSVDVGETSHDSREEALEWGDEEYLTTFEVCAHCGAIEAESHDDQDGADWQYLTAIWPCATARALRDEQECGAL